MRKRMRKKKHVGEFKLLGFEIKGTWKRPLAPPYLEDEKIAWHAEQDVFLDALIDFVEARNLSVGGGGNAQTFGYYVTKGRWAIGKHPRRWIDVNATEEDVAVLAEFLSSSEIVGTSKAGPLVDSWYGWEDDDEERAA